MTGRVFDGAFGGIVLLHKLVDVYYVHVAWMFSHNIL